MIILTLLTLSALCNPSVSSLIDACTKSKDSPREPLVAALLDLHSGPQCDQPNIASFQQLAVLDAAVKRVNNIDKSKIGFQIFDTCSTEQGTVTASMQAFVSSQQTCLHSPLFSGFIGPENYKFLKAVRNFTGSFNFTHVLPYSIFSNNFVPNKALHVAKYPSASFVQTIESLIERMGLISPMIISESSPRSDALTVALRTARSDICSKRIVFTLSTPSEVEETIDFSRVHDGLIILVESEEFMKSVNRVLDSESIQDPVIIAVLHNPSSLSQHNWNTNVLFVNQVSSSILSTSVKDAVKSFVMDSSRICSKYKLTSCDEHLLLGMMDDEYDWTLQLYHLSVLLLNSAVTTAQKLKCDSKPCLSPDTISQNEWHNILRSASAVLDPKKKDKPKITFDMDLPASYILKTSFGPDGLKSIGKIANGQLFLERDLLPIRIKNVTCPVENEPVQEVVTSSSSGGFDFLDNMFRPENTKLFEAVGLVCGAVVGILLLMLIMTSCVYKTFKDETTRPRSPMSHTTVSRVGSNSS